MVPPASMVNESSAHPPFPGSPDLGPIEALACRLPRIGEPQSPRPPGRGSIETATVPTDPAPSVLAGFLLGQSRPASVPAVAWALPGSASSSAPAGSPRQAADTPRPAIRALGSMDCSPRLGGSRSRRNRLGDGSALMGALTEGISRVSRVLSDEQGGGRRGFPAVRSDGSIGVPLGVSAERFNRCFDRCSDRFNRPSREPSRWGFSVF